MFLEVKLVCEAVCVLMWGSEEGLGTKAGLRSPEKPELLLIIIIQFCSVQTRVHFIVFDQLHNKPPVFFLFIYLNLKF